MDFNTLDKQMRRFEQSMDRTLLEGIYVVARLDGHGFTRLTKKEWNLEKPFDIRFRDALKRLPMTIGSRKVRCGLRQIHFHHKGMEGFTESVLNTEVILASLR